MTILAFCRRISLVSCWDTFRKYDNEASEPKILNELTELVKSQSGPKRIKKQKVEREHEGYITRGDAPVPHNATFLGVLLNMI